LSAQITNLGIISEICLVSGQIPVGVCCADSYFADFQYLSRIACRPGAAGYAAMLLIDRDLSAGVILGYGMFLCGFKSKSAFFLKKYCGKIWRIKKSPYLCSPFEKQR